jgi:uncharacterized protein YkwD
MKRVQIGVLIWFGLCSSAGIAHGQTGGGNRSDPEAWRELEAEMLREINLLRSQPADYATKFLLPLKQAMVRVPEDRQQPFQGYKFVFNSKELSDYIVVAEGGSERTAGAVLDEAMASLQAAPKLGTLGRNVVLDRAARFNACDFAASGKKRNAHVDSLGRAPGARISAFGATRDALRSWERLTKSLNGHSQTVVRVFQEDGRYYLVELRDNGYRYWSVPDSFGKLIADQGREATIPLLGKPGHECTVRVHLAKRALQAGDAVMAYPWPMPIHGENVVWGDWSRRMAARGLVCWWLLDPDRPDRGHRKILLDPDFKYCGIGCTWSAAKGWVATLDLSAEPLEEFPK